MSRAHISKQYFIFTVYFMACCIGECWVGYCNGIFRIRGIGCLMHTNVGARAGSTASTVHCTVQYTSVQVYILTLLLAVQTQIYTGLFRTSQMPEQNREKYGSTLTESNERPFIERQTVEYLRFIFVNNKNIYCSTV